MKSKISSYFEKSKTETNSTPETKNKAKKKIAIILLALAFILLAIVITVVVVFYWGSYCKSGDCLRMSAELLYSIDESVDPCDDFYESICGKFIENYYFNPASKSDLSYMERSGQLITNKIGKFIKLNRTTNWLPEKVMRSYYETCINSNGDTNLKEILAATEEIGGCPLLGLKTTTLNDILEKLAPIMPHQLGLFRFSIVPASQKDGFVIFIRPGINKGKFDSFEALSTEYTRLISKIRDINLDEAKGYMKEMMHFAKQIQNLDVVDGNVQYKQMNIEDLTKALPDIAWDKVLNAITQGKQENMKQLEQRSAILGTLANQQLSTLIQQNPTVAKSWISFQYFAELINFTPLNGENEKRENEESCINQVSNLFPSVVGKGYVEGHVEEEKITKIEQMIEQMKVEFKDWFQSNNWMDEETRNAAITKVDKMKSIVGHPKDLRKDNYLTDLYKKLKFEPTDSNVVMHKKIKAWQGREMMDSLFRNDPIEFVQEFTTVNAFYVAALNTFVITSAILDDGIFSVNYPNSFNYGSIGLIIGHEIGHGFDSTGKQYDSEGHQKKWWSAEAERKYNETTNCFKEQYSNYQFPGVNATMNGSQTLDENIADNIGGMIAFQALKNSGWSNVKLFGLDKYSDEQIFFFAYGHTFCASPIEQHTRSRYRSDPHAMGRFRVNGVVSNMPEFASAFKCKEGSRMNPTKKCTLK